jgi:hypothetical protein
MDTFSLDACLAPGTESFSGIRLTHRTTGAVQEVSYPNIRYSRTSDKIPVLLQVSPTTYEPMFLEVLFT